ncbi:MAG: lysylphosphatidylglycerol synthase domain-containing protein, partial [Thermodesulfobacteriota bacterium]
MAVMVLPLLFFYAPGFPRALLWLMIFCLITGLISLLLLLRDSPPPFLTRLLSRLPFAAKLSQVSSSFLLYRNHPLALGRFFLWSFGEQIVPILTMYLLVLALGLSVPFHYLIFIIPVAQFFARIPISLSGFGIQEGLFVTLFSFLGLSATTAFALGFASNLGNLLIGVPGAFFYLKGDKGGIG